MIDIAKPKLRFGIKIGKWKIPACGGIRMDIDVEQAEVTTRPALEQWEARILGARPSPDTLWWELSSMPESHSEVSNLPHTGLALGHVP